MGEFNVRVVWTAARRPELNWAGPKWGAGVHPANPGVDDELVEADAGEGFVEGLVEHYEVEVEAAGRVVT